MCKSPLNINSRLVYIFFKMVELVSRLLVIVIEGCSNLLSTSNLWSSTPFLFIYMLCNLYFSFGMLEKIAVMASKSYFNVVNSVAMEKVPTPAQSCTSWSY